MMVEHQISQRQACKAVNLAVSTLRYEPRPRNDQPVIAELQQLVDKHPAIGFWIRRKGLTWGSQTHLPRIYGLKTEHSTAIPSPLACADKDAFCCNRQALTRRGALSL